MLKLTQLPPTPVNTLKNARDIAVQEGLKFVYMGNVPGLGSESTTCPKCNKVVVERRGYSIIQNNLENGKCKFCSSPVGGVWEKS